MRHGVARDGAARRRVRRARGREAPRVRAPDLAVRGEADVRLRREAVALLGHGRIRISHVGRVEALAAHDLVDEPSRLLDGPIVALDLDDARLALGDALLDLDARAGPPLQFVDRLAALADDAADEALGALERRQAPGRAVADGRRVPDQRPHELDARADALGRALDRD